MSCTYEYIIPDEEHRLAIPYLMEEIDGVVQNPPPETLPKWCPIIVKHVNTHYVEKIEPYDEEEAMRQMMEMKKQNE